MTTDILSPEVREAWEAMLDGTLGARVDFVSKYRQPVAAAIEAALIRGAEAEKEVKRCHERLEIDHYFVMNNEGDDLIRCEVPMEKRAEWPDKIVCLECDVQLRDEEIAELRSKLTNTPQQGPRHPMQGLEGESGE